MKKLNLIITAGFYLAFAAFVQSFPCDTKSMAIGLCGAGKILMLVSLAIIYSSYFVCLRFVQIKRPYIITIPFILFPPIAWFLLSNHP